MSLKNHNYRQILKVLTKHYGFSIERQNGSHIQLKNPDGSIINWRMINLIFFNLQSLPNSLNFSQSLSFYFMWIMTIFSNYFYVSINENYTT